ncbi:MAG: hypothetical protein M3R69_11255 [Acidobacteriota bacterium]|nr:hypothetical protein [Acidobacteriota bacterium]
MALSIHDRVVRFIAAVFVFVLLLSLIGPHLMDVEPPLFVRVLMKPVEVVSKTVGEVVPLHNIGTAEKPFYEATPIHLLLGLLLVFFCILLYPFATYLLLSILSRFIGGRVVKDNSPQ